MRVNACGASCSSVTRSLNWPTSSRESYPLAHVKPGYPLASIRNTLKAASTMKSIPNTWYAPRRDCTCGLAVCTMNFRTRFMRGSSTVCTKRGPVMPRAARYCWNVGVSLDGLATYMGHRWSLNLNALLLYWKCVLVRCARGSSLSGSYADSARRK